MNTVHDALVDSGSFVVERLRFKRCGEPITLNQQPGYGQQLVHVALSQNR
jgi:hypothetical protein